jgi:GTP-binding protein
MDSRYITSAAKPEQLPAYEQPEIAFFGRSNTGKSTLLNVLLNRRNLARQSRTPGRTQMVNFFSVNNQLILADLPGYGFSHARRDVAKNWQPLIDAYIQRPNIKEFLFLWDCRRDFTETDLSLMFFLSKQLPLRIVLTKSDKLSRSQLQSRIQRCRRELAEAGVRFHEIYQTSATKNLGFDQLRQDILVPYWGAVDS